MQNEVRRTGKHFSSTVACVACARIITSAADHLFVVMFSAMHCLLLISCQPPLLLLQEAISNFQRHGSIMRVAPAPPRASMQLAEAALKKRRVSIEWLAAYLLPPELEAVARASLFAGPFTVEGAAAVGCRASWAEQLGQQQPGACSEAASSSFVVDQQDHIAVGVEQVLNGLVQMSVLREEGASYTGGRRFSMHPLIRELGRELQDGKLQEVYGGGGGSVEVLMVQWVVADAGGPGARLVLHQPSGSQSDIRVWQGVMVEEAANFREAAGQLGRAGDNMVMDNKRLLERMLDVADAMRAVGYWSQARLLAEAVVDVRTRNLGPEHPDTLRGMHSLALTMHDMGHLPEAYNLHQKLLVVRTRVLGPEHPATLSTMHSLAITLIRKPGDLPGARELQQKAMVVRTRVLGPEHPRTLCTMHRLAITLSLMGDLPGARDLEQKVMVAFIRVLGPEHPDTMHSMHSLAITLSRMGDLPEARELQERVLDVRTRVLGPEHPRTLRTMHTLGITLSIMGNLPRACELEQKVLVVRTRVLGPEHQDTLSSMHYLAFTLSKMGDLPGARELQQKVLVVRTRVMGPEHPETLSSMHYLAITLSNMGDMPRARELSEKVVSVCTRVLGPEHPDTLNTIIMGPDYPDTLKASIDLYAMMWELGDCLEAPLLLKGCAAAAARGLGADHPVTKHAEDWLCVMLQRGNPQGGGGAGAGLFQRLGRFSRERRALPLLAAAAVVLLLRGLRPRRAAGQAGGSP
jgi:hypothetical protein